MIAFPGVDGERVRALRLAGGWVDRHGKPSLEAFAEQAGLAARTVRRAENGEAGPYALIALARAFQIAPVNLLRQCELDLWLAGRERNPVGGQNNECKTDTEPVDKEAAMSETAEILRKYQLLPNEYRNVSLEITFRNWYSWFGRNYVLRWYSLGATESYALEGFGVVAGSTILTTDACLEGLGDNGIKETVYAVGDDAKRVLDAPPGATIEARVKTVFATAVDETTRHDLPDERIYEELKGLLIEEILAISGPPDA